MLDRHGRAHEIVGSTHRQGASGHGAVDELPGRCLGFAAAEQPGGVGRGILRPQLRAGEAEAAQACTATSAVVEPRSPRPRAGELTRRP